MTSETVLIAGAQRWIREALDAWTQDDQEKVALMAPIAVELLGKATLWRENPVLLVQLNERNEASLFLLATRPDLTEECLRPVDLLGGRTFPGFGRWSSSEGRRWRVGREGTPVLTVVPEDGSAEGGSSLIDEIVRDGARRMLVS